MDLQAAKLNVIQKIVGVTKSSLLEKISDLLDTRNGGGLHRGR